MLAEMNTEQKAASVVHADETSGRQEAPLRRGPVQRDWPDLWEVEPMLNRLSELGISDEALKPAREWLKQQHWKQDRYHERHLKACGITSLAGHRYGWGNCPNFICWHCGSPPDADGDHSCPCPYRDEECPDHGR